MELDEKSGWISSFLYKLALVYIEIRLWCVGQTVKTPPFHGGIMGSIPVRIIYGVLDELVESPPFHGGIYGFKPHTHHMARWSNG